MRRGGAGPGAGAPRRGTHLVAEHPELVRVVIVVGVIGAVFRSHGARCASPAAAAASEGGRGVVSRRSSGESRGAFSRGGHDNRVGEHVRAGAAEFAAARAPSAAI